MAMSPFVRPPLFASAKAGNPLASSPVPKIPAPPTANPLRKKERRLVETSDDFDLCSKIFSFRWLSPPDNHYRNGEDREAKFRESLSGAKCVGNPEITKILRGYFFADATGETTSNVVPSP